MPAATKVRTYVTQLDIDQGVCEDENLCAVAIAMQRCTGKPWMVDGDFAESYDPYVRVRLPPAIVVWIKDFDLGRPVKPIDFEAEIVGWSDAYGAEWLEGDLE